MRTEARHRLKEDPFAEGVRELFDWFAQHQVNIIGGIVIAAVIIGGYLIWWQHSQSQNEQANLMLGQAIRTMNAPVGAGGEPGVEIYSTNAARNAAAEKKFSELAGKFPHTSAGQFAEYYEGVVKMDSGDNAGAEQQLKKAESLSNQDAASLAKMALAALYVSTNRAQDAVAICNDLIAHPTSTVTQEQAQMQLATAYEATQPQQALKIYQQLAAKDPGGPIGNLAMQRMANVQK